MVSVINDGLISAGKPPVGFINQVLYKVGTLGLDIVDGNNKVGGCPAGFPAVKGWDAITGIRISTVQESQRSLDKRLKRLTAQLEQCVCRRPK
eukprot:UN18379